MGTLGDVGGSDGGAVSARVRRRPEVDAAAETGVAGVPGVPGV